MKFRMLRSKFLVGAFSLVLIFGMCLPTRVLADVEPLLCVAAKSGDLQEVQRLVAGGAYLECEDSAGRTPLYCAAMHNHLTIVDWLASNPVSSSCKEKALRCAVEKGYFDVVLCLLDHGANRRCTIDCYDSYLDGRLHFSLLAYVIYAFPFNRPLLDDLRRRGCCFSDLDSLIFGRMIHRRLSGKSLPYDLLMSMGEYFSAGGTTEIFDRDLRRAVLGDGYFCSDDFHDVVKVLLKSPRAKDCINEFDEKHRTLLYYAVERGDYKMVDLLVKGGARVVPQGKRDNVLHRAAWKNRSDILIRLLAAPGARECVNDRNGLGHTPLHNAAMSGCIEGIKPLADAGARMKDAGCKCGRGLFGKTPYKHARYERHGATAREISKYGG